MHEIKSSESDSSKAILLLLCLFGRNNKARKGNIIATYSIAWKESAETKNKHEGKDTSFEKTSSFTSRNVTSTKKLSTVNKKTTLASR